MEKNSGFAKKGKFCFIFGFDVLLESIGKGQ